MSPLLDSNCNPFAAHEQTDEGVHSPRDFSFSAFQLFLNQVHLVFLNQYYPPDAAPTGVMLEAVVERLVRDGHEVTVLCASGGYADSRHKTLRRKRQEGDKEEENVHARRSQFTIIRIGASSFGRGTFVGKLLDYASYYVGVALKLWVMNPQPDRIVALTTPPLISVLARLFSKIRGADHAHWVMDLYPDVMAAHGMLGERSIMYRILTSLARWGFGGRRCAAVLTLGPDMAERLLGKNPKTEIKEDMDMAPTQASSSTHQPSTLNHQLSSAQWVPLWGTEERLKTGTEGAEVDSPSTSSLRHQRGWVDGELIVMYSGNMGLGHRFGEILAAASRSVGVSPTSVPDFQPSTLPISHQLSTLNHQLSSHTRFVFFGGGKRRVEVEAFVRENPRCAVEVHDYAPAAELAAHLRSADVHLASLDAAWTGTMVPSKLQGIFAAGRPVIFIGSADSSIGRWVAESGGGWVILPGDVDSLLAALDEARDPEIRLTRGRAAKEFADKHFDKRTNVARVAGIFTSGMDEASVLLTPHAIP